MLKKKIILSFLILNMSLYLLHDLLPYHNHGMSHFISGNSHHQVIKNVEDGKHECDGHGLCVICLMKELSKIQVNHLEIDFSVNSTDLVVKIEKIKVPSNQYSFLFKLDNSHRYKTEFIRQAHSLRAPPVLV